MKYTAQSLENAALFYLERYASTKQRLRQVMLRKLKRAAGEKWDPAQAKLMVDALIERLAAYLDDSKFAEHRTASLRARGGSTRAISAKLRMKGVGSEDIAQALKGTDELAAAIAYAKRKKLLASDPKKQLASLARAGFSYAIAKQALNDLQRAE